MITLNRIYNEDCRETMKRMDNNSIDSIVTDPPYELGFMGKHWDSSEIAYNVELWGECLRVLKPGGYLLAFGGTRTSHRMVCAIEDAGFEIRDSILWLYGSGFPKSMDISKQIDKEQGAERPREMRFSGTIKGGGLHAGKENGNARSWNEIQTKDAQTKDANQWQGYGTALKPAHEPICVARKPISEKTVAQNVLKWGTGGINIDGCRIDADNRPLREIHPLRDDVKYSPSSLKGRVDGSLQSSKAIGTTNLGRFPSNIILEEFTAQELDKQAPDAGAFAKVKKGHNGKSKGIYGDYAEKGDDGDTFYDDKGGASRFFYIAKADRDERNNGLHQFKKEFESMRPFCTEDSDRDKLTTRLNSKSSQNFHPTVKPVKLGQYLQRLVTPKGGTTYDPFGGSGTFALSAQNEGFNWILSEKIAEYCDISEKRIYNNGGLFL